jgi:hypothetical protein
MKNLILAFGLLAFTVACGKHATSDNGGNASSDPAAHQQTIHSLTSYGDSNQVISDRFGSTSSTPTAYADANMQAMATALVPCTVVWDGAGGGSMGGTSCPVTFTQTVTSTSSSSTMNFGVAYTVVSASFQAYNTVKSFNLKSTMTGLSSSASGGLASFTASFVTTDQGNLTFNGSVISTAPDTSGEYTETVAFTANSSTDQVSYGAVANVHNDSLGKQITDSETCTFNGAPISCSAEPSPAVTAMSRQARILRSVTR